MAHPKDSDRTEELDSNSGVWNDATRAMSEPTLEPPRADPPRNPSSPSLSPSSPSITRTSVSSGGGVPQIPPSSRPGLLPVIVGIALMAGVVLGFIGGVQLERARERSRPSPDRQPVTSNEQARPANDLARAPLAPKGEKPAEVPVESKSTPTAPPKALPANPSEPGKSRVAETHRPIARPLETEATEAPEKKLQPVDWRRRSRDWLAQFQAENKDVWPDLRELDRVLDEVQPDSKSENADGYQRLRQEVARRTDSKRRPFVKLHPRVGLADDAEWRLRSVARLFDHVVHADVGKGPKKEVVTLEIVLEGGTPARIPTNRSPAVDILATESGYVTLVIFEGRGSLFAMQWRERLPAGERRRLVTLAASEPGEDTLCAFLTDKSLLEPDEAREPARTEDAKQGFLKGFRRQWLTKEDVAELRSSVVDPNAFDRAIAAMKEGKSVPLADPGETRLLGRATVKIEWGAAP